MKIKELCLDERPREKLMGKGPHSLTNSELIAILLRTGTRQMNAIDIARTLLKDSEGRLSALSGLSIDRLCMTEGIGPGKAVTMAAAFEIARRYAMEKATVASDTISSPRDVFRIMYPMMKNLDHEECWCIFLNKANRMLSRERMSSGGAESTVIDNKAIIRKALEKHATAVIIIHNHPSGNATPSKADMTMTLNLRRALAACELDLTDHVIIGHDNWYSFADEELCDGHT